MFRGCYSRDAWTAEAIFSKLPEKKWRRGTSIYMFWFRFIPEMSSALSAAFLYGRAFVCFSACLAVHYFAVYTGLVCFKNQANFNGNGNGNGNAYNGCVSVRYNSLFISLPLFTKVHKTTSRNSHIICIFQRTWTKRRPILKFLSRILRLSYIFCLGYFWQYRQTEWIHGSNSREIRRVNIYRGPALGWSTVLKCRRFGFSTLHC